MLRNIVNTYGIRHLSKSTSKLRKQENLREEKWTERHINSCSVNIAMKVPYRSTTSPSLLMKYSKSKSLSVPYWLLVRDLKVLCI